jgi:hypothetical protein
MAKIAMPPVAPPGRRLPKALQNQPALMERGWLPEGIFPELDELREEHHQHLDACNAAQNDSIELHRQYEDEDRARAAALTAGDKVPAVTGSADRQDALDEASARYWATVYKLAAFVERAAEVFKEKGGERPQFPDEPGLQLSPWRQTFAATRAEAEQEEAEARELLRAAERKVARMEQIETWLNRTVKPRGGRYISAPEFGSRPTRAEREANRMPAALAEAMGGEAVAV